MMTIKCASFLRIRTSCIGRRGLAATLSTREHSQHHGSHRHRHTLALARDLPESFATASLSHYADSDIGTSPIDMTVARQQHDAYLHWLRQRIPVLCLPPLEDHADCVFVEDTVVCVGHQAVLTRPGHASRQGEVATIGVVLKQLGMQVWDMADLHPDAICDGGDVLYTGRHVFVGMSGRSNHVGADILESVFTHQQQQLSLPLVRVPMDPKKALHLKSVVAHIDEYTLVAPEGDLGDEVLQAMNARDLGYETTRLPNMAACNFLSVVNNHGGTSRSLLASETTCEISRHKLQKVADQKGMSLDFVPTTEVAKSDGALTCCSVLLQI